MKADIPLRERRCIEADAQRELRAALVRRHVHVIEDEHAIEAAQIALDIRTAPVFRTLAERMQD